ncbi:hypothetical protein BLNAU_25033 [Blattamonas nauphoetae]|uniref:Uncharacterized protein n=1 Tax=Blattamonas nauphoetae TaxID=2049346 RepID=A0ABQ9WPU1_9EUKA|nr:hypothetical protein BLNAU_25033 [Blattamonas nauphoetae]
MINQPLRRQTERSHRIFQIKHHLIRTHLPLPKVVRSRRWTFLPIEEKPKNYGGYVPTVNISGKRIGTEGANFDRKFDSDDQAKQRNEEEIYEDGDRPLSPLEIGK